MEIEALRESTSSLNRSVHRSSPNPTFGIFPFVHARETDAGALFLYFSTGVMGFPFFFGMNLLFRPMFAFMARNTPCLSFVFQLALALMDSMLLYYAVNANAYTMHGVVPDMGSVVFATLWLSGYYDGPLQATLAFFVCMVVGINEPKALITFAAFLTPFVAFRKERCVFRTPSHESEKMVRFQRSLYFFCIVLFLCVGALRERLFVPLPFVFKWTPEPAASSGARAAA